MDFNRKTLVILTTSLAMFAGLIGFVIYPLFQEILESSEELFSARNELAFTEGKIRESLISNKKIALLRPELDKMQEFLVNPEMPVDFLRFLEEMALGHNLEIETSFLSQKQKENLPFPFLVFKVILKGGFSDCLKFLGKLETAPYLVNIESLAIQEPRTNLIPQEGEVAGLQRVEFNLIVDAFIK